MNRWWCVIILLSCGLVFLVKIVLFWPSGNLKYIQCNVGQGDTVLVIRNSIQILYDSGGGDSVIDCLEKNIPFWDRKIELAIASHADKDHIGGFSEVMARYKVKLFIWNGDNKENVEWKNLLEIVDKKKINIIKTRDFKMLKIGNVNIERIWPDENNNQDDVNYDSNDYSVVMKVSFGKTDMLLTGDITEKIENKIINHIENVNSEILKVSHHGSKYSSSNDFLDKIQAKIAIIGVGKNNYGHPAFEVLERLKQKGIIIKRTDMDGEIKMETNGKEIWFVK